jgi:hypothetical protein
VLIPTEWARELVMNDKKITRVQFRKVRNQDTKKDEIVAIFVDEIWDIGGFSVACYSHDGQHSGCAKEWYKHLRYATRAEYDALKRELESDFGYNFKVLNKAA